MATTVLVLFDAKPGNGDALYHALSGSDEVMVSVEGCKHVELLRDEHDPDRIVEIEVWDSPEQREAWLAGRAEDGTFQPLEPLLAGQPKVHYLVTPQGAQVRSRG